MSGVVFIIIGNFKGKLKRFYIIALGKGMNLFLFVKKKSTECSYKNLFVNEATELTQALCSVVHL